MADMNLIINPATRTEEQRAAILNLYNESKDCLAKCNPLGLKAGVNSETIVTLKFVFGSDFFTKGE